MPHPFLSWQAKPCAHYYLFGAPSISRSPLPYHNKKHGNQYDRHKLKTVDTLFYIIQWLQIWGDNIFLTLEWQFPVAFYIGFSVAQCGFNSLYLIFQLTSIKCSNKLILDNSGVLFHVVAINNLFTALYYSMPMKLEIKKYVFATFQSARSPGGSICKRRLPVQFSAHLNHFQMTNS